jgi:hypothetical protein
MKMFPKLLFTHGRQTLIVKTWERISEIDPKEETNKDTGKPGDHFIKTIRIFDNQFKQIKSILVE